MMNWVDLDLSMFHAINAYCGWNWTLDHILGSLQGNSLIGGGLYLATFWVLWFQPAEDQIRRREVLITLLLAVMLALIANRVLSSLLPFRIRPMFNPGIGYRAPIYDHPPFYDLENWSGFPSDYATYFSALTTGFWFFSRRLGIFFTLFTILCVLLPRIYFGLHYPSDVLVGALIGIGVTLAVERERVRKLVAWPVLTMEQSASVYFNALMFLIVFETANVFGNVRRVGTSAFHLLQHYHYL